MSYDIKLKHPVTGKTLKADKAHHMKGGTFVLGGTEEMWLNVTYNYGSIFRRVLGPEGIRTIYGMTGAQAIPLLNEAASKLGNDVNDDYWEPTEGNAKAALLSLAAMAQMRPDGVFDGD